MDQAKVIDRCKKLLALAGSNPNEHEALAAAEKLHATLAEHNLSLKDVMASTTKEDHFIIDGDTKSKSVPWRRRVAASVAELYFCQYFYTMFYDPNLSRACGYIRYDIHSFVGAEHNIIIAKMMFTYLTDTIERLAKEGARKVNKAHKSGYDTSFKAACTSRVASRIYERIQEAKKGGQIKTEGGTNLPALADLYEQTKKQLTEFTEKKVGKMKVASIKSTLTNAAAVHDGLAAGDRIGLDKQVEGAANAPRLT